VIDRHTINVIDRGTIYVIDLGTINVIDRGTIYVIDHGSIDYAILTQSIELICIRINTQVSALCTMVNRMVLSQSIELMQNDWSDVCITINDGSSAQW
jgi:hypothetical protein